MKADKQIERPWIGDRMRFEFFAANIFGLDVTALGSSYLNQATSDAHDAWTELREKELLPAFPDGNGWVKNSTIGNATETPEMIINRDGSVDIVGATDVMHMSSQVSDDIAQMYSSTEFCATRYFKLSRKVDDAIWQASAGRSIVSNSIVLPRHEGTSRLARNLLLRSNSF